MTRRSSPSPTRASVTSSACAGLSGQQAPGCPRTYLTTSWNCCAGGSPRSLPSPRTPGPERTECGKPCGDRGDDAVFLGKPFVLACGLVHGMAAGGRYPGSAGTHISGLEPTAVSSASCMAHQGEMG